MALGEGLFHWTEFVGKGNLDRILLEEADMKSRVQDSWLADVQWEIIL